MKNSREYEKILKLSHEFKAFLLVVLWLHNEEDIFKSIYVTIDLSPLRYAAFLLSHTLTITAAAAAFYLVTYVLISYLRFAEYFQIIDFAYIGIP